MAEVKARLARAGETPSPYVAHDGKPGLVVSLCPAPDSMRSFSVEFDPQGYALTIELQALVW